MPKDETCLEFFGSLEILPVCALPALLSIQILCDFGHFAGWHLKI